jgi:hypothetical protein
MESNLISYADMEELTPGMSTIICDSMGECTFVGWSAEGCVVVQREHDFTTLPELTFNMMHWRKPFDPETHVRYISEESLHIIQHANPVDIHLSEHPTALHRYKVTLHIHEHVMGDQQ